MNSTDSSQEMIDLYLSECDQLLQKFEKIIIDSEKKEELINPPELFRLLHTLKGSSAMMGFNILAETAHAFESILSAIKSSGQILYGEQLAPVIDAALEFTTYFRTEFSRISAGNDPIKNEELVHSIHTLSIDSCTAQESTENTENPSRTILTDTVPVKKGELCITVKLRNCSLPHIRASIIAKSISKLCFLVSTVPEHIQTATEYDSFILSKGFEIRFIPITDITVESVINKIASQPFVSSCILTNHNTTDSLNTTPVSQADKVGLIQNVTVAQSVINQIINYLNEIASAEYAVENCAENIGLHSGQMQELLSVLRRTIADTNILASKIGSQNMESVFIQMQRTVHTMAKDLHKTIKVKTYGADVIIDKSIREILSDCMIHIVRNAVDHGIEPPEKREAYGKPKTGLITLKAVKKNDYLTVTVTDDGAGINHEAVLQHADLCGKLTKPKTLYTDNDIYNLLLSSRVSTNKEVTQYSGRGVGIDTVVQRVKQAGGKILIKSKEGIGTTFTLKIPITLRILDGIEILLENGNELILPANAIEHVFSAVPPEYYIPGKGKQQIEYRGTPYIQLQFPGESFVQDENREGYTLLFNADFGAFFIKAKKVSMISSYYVKPMPDFVKDALESDYIYSGCVLCKDAKLRCVLDIQKLIYAPENRNLTERVINL